MSTPAWRALSTLGIFVVEKHEQGQLGWERINKGKRERRKSPGDERARARSYRNLEFYSHIVRNHLWGLWAGSNMVPFICIIIIVAVLVIIMLYWNHNTLNLWFPKMHVHDTPKREVSLSHFFSVNPCGLLILSQVLIKPHITNLF